MCFEIAVTIIKELTTPFHIFLFFNMRFLWGASRIATSLHALTMQEVEFKCTEEAEVSLHSLKGVICKPLVLPFFYERKRFFVHTDTSKCALWALLMQIGDNNKTFVMQWASRSFSATLRSFSSFEWEAATVILVLNNFQPQLLGDTFIVYSRHKSSQAVLEKVGILELIAW